MKVAASLLIPLAILNLPTGGEGEVNFIGVGTGGAAPTLLSCCAS